MSTKYPIISVTGSSGAGTTFVRHTFEYIFRRENVNAAFVQGDAFHRYNRQEMEAEMKAAEARGDQNFSHFGEKANLLAELEELFRSYSDCGRGRTRTYVHDEAEEKSTGSPIGSFTPWVDIPRDTDILLYEGLHGAVITKDVNIARHADLKIGVVPVINLEWI